ncbi:small ribosomal subunit protein mS38 isoform 2-T4 [Ciconia maguari]
MLISQLTSQLLKASRITGHLLPRSVSSFLCSRSTSAHYCTQPSNRSGAQPQRWYALDPELEEEEVGYEPLQRYDCPPSDEGADVEEGEGALSNKLQCKNVLKIRRRKMNRHKFKKLLKRRKFVRRRIKEGRKKKRQIKFEKDLERIWKRAGLKNPPAGWQTPKIFLKSSKQ